MLLEGKRILVMGLMDPDSYAWAIGKQAAKEGAHVVFSVINPKLVQRFFRGDPDQELLKLFELVECNVTDDGQLRNLFSRPEPYNGIVYSIAFANPKTCLGKPLWEAPAEDVKTAFEVSAIRLAHTVGYAVEGGHLPNGGSIVAMTFESQQSFPGYNWMSACKAALESVSRVLAMQLGNRGIKFFNLSAGPQKTRAAVSIPGFEAIAEAWPGRAPLGWDLFESRQEVANWAVMLLSDYSNGGTGELIHVDGGFHAVAGKVNETEPTVLPEKTPTEITNIA